MMTFPTSNCSFKGTDVLLWHPNEREMLNLGCELITFQVGVSGTTSDCSIKTNRINNQDYLLLPYGLISYIKISNYKFSSAECKLNNDLSGLKIKDTSRGYFILALKDIFRMFFDTYEFDIGSWIKQNKKVAKKIFKSSEVSLQVYKLEEIQDLNMLIAKDQSRVKYNYSIV